MNYNILTGDAVSMLRTLPAQSVHCAVTSPPYYGLRDYGVDGQIGLEASPAEYVGRLVEVFREVGRVLRDDGSLWVNIGDSYYGGKGENGNSRARLTANERGYSQSAGTVTMATRPLDRPIAGLKPKDLIGIPWRLAFALQDDGWFLRSEITWCKRAPMPESVQDRPTSATEKIFLLTKRARYFYDAVAVREDGKEWTGRSGTFARDSAVSLHVLPGQSAAEHRSDRADRVMPGANLRNFWLLSPDPYPDAHFATFPREIPKRAILAGTSAQGCCPVCGAPWVRVLEKEIGEIDGGNKSKILAESGMDQNGTGKSTLSISGPSGGVAWAERGTRIETLGFSPSCACAAGDPVPCTVLDPFLGSGTTVQVALSLGRHGVGVELNPVYVELAHKRIRGTQPALMGL